MNTYEAVYARFKRLNPQIIAYRNRKWARLIVKWLIAVGVIMAIALIAYPTSPTMLPIGVIAAIALPLWRLRPWHCFKRGWIGTIESHEFEESYENVDKKLNNFRYSHRHLVTYIQFSAMDSKGKKHTFKLDRQYETIYQIGDRVMFVPGLDYPIDLTVQNKTVCPRCGSIFPSENEHCVTIGCKMPSIYLDTREIKHDN